MWYYNKDFWRRKMWRKFSFSKAKKYQFTKIDRTDEYKKAFKAYKRGI